jgi:hypothetical protein
MRNKNKIKAPDANTDTIRGIGKLGYGESSKMHSTIKNLSSTFSDTVRTLPGKKEKVKCPGCGQKFKSNSGKIPQHRKRWGNDICDQQKSRLEPPRIVSVAPSVTINGYEVRKGEEVAFTTYPWNLGYVDPMEVRGYVIKELYLMDNNKIYLSLEGVEDMVSSTIFARNFIKL